MEKTENKKNKAEIVSEMAAKTGRTKKDSLIFLDAALDVIAENLAEGISVNFTNFGKFELVDFEARNGTNPSTGEKIYIPAKKLPKFKASGFLKDLVNGIAEA